MRNFVVAALVIGTACPAWAINKCTSADGKVTFQEAACPRDQAAQSIGQPTGVPQKPKASVVNKELALPMSEDELKLRVRNSLKDPNSAEFKDVRWVAGKALCGQVNAKNSYGGYVGFKFFVADSDGVYWMGDSSSLDDIGSKTASRTYVPRAHAWGCLG
jgi:hypothetical protein